MKTYLIAGTAALLVFATFAMMVTGAEPSESNQVEPTVVKPVAGQERPPSVIATKLERLYAVDESPLYSGNARIEAITSAHHQLFAEEQGSALDSVSDADLDFLYRAAHTAAFYSGEPAHANEMTRLLAELEARGLANKKHHVDMYRALVHARMFDQARALRHTYPLEEMEVLPVFHMAPGIEGPTAWSVSPDARLLTEQPVDLQAPVTIVVVSHPGCRYSQAAVAAISEDAVLGPVFARHAQWLAPPSGKLDFDLMQEWNREHPGTRLSLAVERGDWPRIDSWGTPTFYFFENGQLTAKVSGWPLDGEGRRTEVVDALHDVGLLE